MKNYPWFKSYDPGVPHSLKPYPNISVLDVLADTLKKNPRHPICIFQGRELSFQELEEHSNALAAALLANGVRKGDRVCTLFLNSPQCFIANFAIWKAGAIAVPLNPMYTPFELQHAIKTVRPQVVIVISMYYDTVKNIQPATGVRLVIVTDLDSYTQSPARQEGGSIKLEGEDIWLSDLIKKYRNSSFSPARINKNDTALILFSGGTTGVPKGAMISHHSITITGMQMQAWWKSRTHEWQDRMLGNLPMFHAFGCLVAYGSYLLNHMPQVLISNPRDIKNVLTTIREYNTSSISATPTMLIAILNSPDRRPDDLRHVNRVSSGAAPLMTETKLQVEKIISPDGVVTEGYGMTETAICGTTTPVRGVWKQGSVGCPQPDVVIRIVDIETGTKELPAGEHGEILIKAPNLMQGFWENPQETAEVMREGWLHSGDIGYLDEDGYLFITSRKKDLIKCGGFQVWPRDIEDVLMMHPAVAEACAGGIPDPRQGEAVKAWIVLKEGCETTADELQRFCRERLTGYKVPRFYEFRRDLPKTMVGKVLRRILQDEEKAR